MDRLARRIIPLLLAWSIYLDAAPARAAGLSGGLAGIGIVALGAFVLFSLMAIVFWFVVRSMAKLERQRDVRATGTELVRAPIGLRILAIVQYFMAFGYGFGGFLSSIMPSYYENGAVAGWLVQAIWFRYAFAVLAVLSASGYANASMRGFKLGIALGMLCVANYALSYLVHGLNESMLFDLIPLLFGLVLLALLSWRYRSYFDGEQPSADVSVAS